MNQSYTVKLELSMEGRSFVEREYHALEELGDITGLPHVYWFS